MVVVVASILVVVRQADSQAVTGGEEVLKISRAVSPSRCFET